MFAFSSLHVLVFFSQHFYFGFIVLSANLPPPVSREQLGARILAQERYEQLQVFERNLV